MKTRLLTTVVAIVALSSGVALAQPDHKGGQGQGGHPQGGQAQGGQAKGGQGGQARGGQGQGGQGQGGQGQGGSHAGGQPSAGGKGLGAVFGGGQGGQAGGRLRPAQQARPAQAAGVQRPAARVVRPATSTAHVGAGGGLRGQGAGQAARTIHSAGAPARGAAQARGGSGAQFSYRGQQRARIERGGYNYPSGWGYRRWSSGQSLPLLFLTQAYFFGDYGTYGFGPPPYGYVWVRYGPDLLLVSRRTGRIREVIYGVFY